MRLTAALAGLFLCVIVFATNSSQVSAQAPQQLTFESSTDTRNTLVVLDLVEKKSVEALRAAEPPQPIEHTVAAGETLTTVAKQHETTWRRLYAKNLQISDPNIITAGEKLTVPLADEQLPERALPVPPAQPARSVQATQTSTRSVTRSNTTVYSASRGSSSGNTYAAGYCTWYAKSRRPDLPNNLGNADTWVIRARAQGIPTGSTPRAGAIGQRAMHVVYVERVNGDGTILISEMNYQALGVVSSRTVPAGYFQYIY